MIYDIILLTVVFISMIIGIRNGASKTIVSLIAVFLAATLAFALSKPLADVVFENFLRGPIESKVADSITETISNKGSEFINPIGRMFLSGMDYFGNSGQSLQSSVDGMIAEKGQQAATAIVDMYKPVIVGFVSLILAIILFVIFAFIFKYLSKPMLRLFDFSLVKSTDKLLGGVLGIARGAVAIVALAMVLRLLAPVIPADTFFFGSKSVNESSIFTYIYNGGLVGSIQSFIYNFT